MIKATESTATAVKHNGRGGIHKLPVPQASKDEATPKVKAGPVQEAQKKAFVTAIDGHTTAKEKLVAVVKGIVPANPGKSVLKAKRDLMVSWLVEAGKEEGNARALVSAALLSAGFRGRTKGKAKYSEQAIALADDCTEKFGDEAKSLLLSAYRYLKAS